MPALPDSLTGDDLARHATALHRLARVLVGDEASAEDLAQDALLIGLEHPPRHRGALSGWLAKVARRLALDRSRSELRRLAREVDSAREEAQESHVVALERLEIGRSVLEEVLSLREPYRTTIYLRYWEGIEPAAIAERLAVPVKTIHSRLSRAIEELRERLDAKSGGDRGRWLSVLLPFVTSRSGAMPSSGIGLTPSGAIGWKGVAGGILMVKKAAIVLAVIAVALLCWRVVGSDGWRAGGTHAAAVVVESPTSPGESASTLSPSSDGVPKRGQVVPAAHDDPGESGATSGAIDVLVKLASSGDPVPSAPIRLIRLGVARVPEPYCSTDAAGRVSFDGLAPGKWIVDCLLQGRSTCQVEPGHRAIVEVLIPDGRGLDGVVVNQDEAPVAGAEVWLSYLIDYVPRAASAVTDSRGHFQIPIAGQAHIFGARAKGHAPSTRTFLSATEDHHCVIHLNRNGRSIHGRVHDKQGKPVERALVDMESSPGDRGYSAVADENGLFSYESVPDGLLTIRVASGSYSLWTTTVQPEADKDALLDVTLEPGGKASGIVRSADGQVRSGVYIHCGNGPSILNASAESGEDGSYVLLGLPSGAVSLEAYGQEQGRDSLSTQCSSDSVIRWDPIIGKGPRIGGVVVDETGKTMSGVVVVAMGTRAGRRSTPDQDAGDISQSTTDQIGKFSIVGIHAQMCKLEARDKENITIGSVDHVSADTTDTRIVCRKRDATVHGTILDSEGHPVSGAELMFIIADRSSALPEAESKENGVFESPPLFTGDYQIYVQRTPYLVEVLHVERLASRECRDLGAVRLRNACSVSVVCRSSQARILKVRVETPEGQVVTVGDLPAGPNPSPTVLDRLPGTELRFILLENDQEVARQSFTPLVGQANTLEITLPPRDR